ncbi:MAG: selenium cofactor biosynthesis protein YqeC [Oscillospiraceae bacterium]|nr:selenium cofactor biosynthesis protein YqeC [Oscillospiraceae bacterium]
MGLAAYLEIRPGVTAVIGSGGKTSLLRELAKELPGTVLLTTTTHIFPFDGVPLLESPDRETLRTALLRARVVCAGMPDPKTGKLSALPYELTGLADFVLAEADGSHGLPLKAHEDWEPVIPPGAGRTVLVVGLSGLGRPIAEVCHRPARFAALCGAAERDAATAERVAAVLNREALADVILLNQAEGRREEAAALAALLRTPVVIGSLWKGEFSCWY